MKYGYRRFDNVVLTETNMKSFFEQCSVAKLSMCDGLEHINLSPTNIAEAKILLAHFSFYYKDDYAVRLAFVCHGQIAFWGYCNKDLFETAPIKCQEGLRNGFIDAVVEVIDGKPEITTIPE